MHMLPEDRQALELLVGRYGVAQVLGAIAKICSDKAEHIRQNWGDAELATQWDIVANSIDRLRPAILHHIGV